MCARTMCGALEWRNICTAVRDTVERIFIRFALERSLEAPMKVSNVESQPSIIFDPRANDTQTAVLPQAGFNCDVI